LRKSSERENDIVSRRRQEKLNTRKATAVLFGMLCILTAALCVVAFGGVDGITSVVSDAFGSVALPQKAAVSAASAPVSEEAVSPVLEAASEEPAAAPAEPYEIPSELRAVTIRAGEDFPVLAGAEETRAAIDDALSAIEAMDVMNTVVIDPMDEQGRVLYASDLFESAGDFDALGYAIEAAQARGFYVFVNYYLTDSVRGDEPTLQGIVDAAVIDAVEHDAERFATSYAPNAVLVDGYYNQTDESAYVRYLRLGGARGFEEYRASIAEALVSTARTAFKATNPSIRFGLRVEASWANNYEDPRGSATKAYFSALVEGNTDTLALLDAGLADLIAVKAYGSIGDRNIPFLTVADWWNGVAREHNVPLYIVHAASRAITSEPGWSEYDQLSRQVIDARTLGAYRGSIFNSLTRMRQNQSDFAGKLIGYYEGTVLAEHILQDLELTRPASTSFTTYDPTVVFAGNTDPNTVATINGTQIPVDQNGYFQLEMQLEEGENVFSIVHKGKTATYTITRVTEVIKEITPASGTLTVDGSTKLTITAVAYQEATVTATINGTTVKLSHADSEDEEYANTSYTRFSGVYTVPDATTAVQNLGAVTVTGTWNGITKSKTGATIRVNERVLPSDGQPVVVTAALAETFSSSTVSQYSDPTYFPLPKGSLDYALGDMIQYTVVESGKARTYNFYRLQSGLRVLAEDVAAVGTAQAPANNRITGCTVTSDYESTRVILATKQRVAYTARYSQNAITVQFHYTNSLPDSMSLTQNPLFSAATFKGDTLTLTLRETGLFCGYNAYYDSNDNLVLEFKNPPNGVNGATIVIDPGHGSGDTGALGFLASYPEAVINYGIARRLASILQDYGANVYMIPSNTSYYSLAQRVAFAEAYDPDLFISVHNNSSATSAAASGTEAYYFNPWSYAMANYASQNVASALSTTNRGGRFGYYYVTRTMRYPAILVEGGFVSNQTEYHKLIDDDYQYEIARGIADAAASYFRVMSAGTATGTQTSGSAPDEGDEPASSATDPPQPSGEESEEPASEENGEGEESEPEAEVPGEESGEARSAGGLTINLSAIDLEVGETEELWVDWEGANDAEIEWNLKSSGDDCLTLEADNDRATITATARGSTVVRARIKGDTSTMVECAVNVQ